MWSSIIFGALLILLSLGLVLTHLWSRRRNEEAARDEDERAYLRRRFRRRMQASALIGLVGLAVIGGLWVDEPPDEAIYWSGVLLVVICLLVLAGADAASTRSFFRDVQKRRAAEFRELQREIERYRREQNGELGNPDNERTL